MPLKGAEQIVMLDFFLIFILGLYGLSTGTVQITAFNAVPFPTLAPLPSKANCAYWDFICIGINSNALAQATAYIGWAIVNGPVLFIYFIGTVITFLDIVLTLLASPAFAPNGVPIIGFFFSMLQVVVLFEVIRIFRGSSTGL